MSTEETELGSIRIKSKYRLYLLQLQENCISFFGIYVESTDITI